MPTREPSRRREPSRTSEPSRTVLVTEEDMPLIIPSSRKLCFPAMKIAMMGSGGVGGGWGARLAHIGCDVSFIARGSHLAAMREHGISVENDALGNIHVPKVHVTDDPGTIGIVDVVLIAVKLWDTEAAAEAIRPIVGPHTAVISLQNGVIKDDILRRVHGDRAV